MLCYAMLDKLWYVTPNSVLLLYLMPSHVMSCQVRSGCGILLCCTVISYVMVCYDKLCYIILNYVMLCIYATL